MFKKPNFYKFLNINSQNCRMTSTDTAFAKKTDWKKVLWKIQREDKIKDLYKAKLITFEAESLDNIAKNESSI